MDFEKPDFEEQKVFGCELRNYSVTQLNAPTHQLT
jgi:hypothetical protein